MAFDCLGMMVNFQQAHVAVAHNKYLQTKLRTHINLSFRK